MKRDTSSTLGKGNLVLFISFPTHLYSSLVMDRQGISPSVYNNNDKFDATKNSIDAKMQAQMEEIKALIKSYKRSSSSSRRRSRTHASEHHLRQGHIGIDTITNKNVKVKSSSPTTAQRLHHFPWHLRQATTRNLRLRTYGIFAHKYLKTTIKRSSPSSSPRLPRATTTSTPTTIFLSMGLKNPRSISSGSA